MAVRKIAISVPEEVLHQVDRMAKRYKTTRSGFITQVLSEVSASSTRADVTRKINSLFDDPAIADEQSATAGLFLRAAEPEDSEW